MSVIACQLHEVQNPSEKVSHVNFLTPGRSSITEYDTLKCSRIIRYLSLSESDWCGLQI